MEKEEKELKEIKESLNGINRKIDTIIEESKQRDSIRGALKASYELFFAGIMGAISATLIEAYIKYPSYWFLGVIIVILLGFSIFFSLIIRFTYRRRTLKKSARVKATALLTSLIRRLTTNLNPLSDTQPTLLVAQPKSLKQNPCYPQKQQSSYPDSQTCKLLSEDSYNL
jgi:F0F1-type ATP synthase assembly protein I